MLSVRLAILAVAGVLSCHSAAQATVWLDARPLEQCQAGSHSQARCLPIAEFFGPDGRLANFRDVLWVLGTAGLDGSEAVTVIGENGPEQEILGAILLLVGQRQIRVETIIWSQVVPDDQRGQGRARAMSREKVYQAAMRDHLVVLSHERSSDGVVSAEDDLTALAHFGRRVREGASDLKVRIGGPVEATPTATSWWWSLVAVGAAVAMVLKGRRKGWTS